MNDLIYLEDNKIKVSDSAMQIHEFKDFKRYDRSEKNNFFDKAMAYIFFVYKVFGYDKENISPFANLPLNQRKLIASRKYISPYTLEDMETSKYVQQCVECFLHYSRTQAERLLDSFKEDVDKYISYVETIPTVIKKTMKYEFEIPGSNGQHDTVDIEIEIPNIQTRMDALKSAQQYREMYLKWQLQVNKDNNIKRARGKLFENPEDIKKIDTSGFPISNE